MNNKIIQNAIGTRIENEQSIIDFINSMSKDYNIELEDGIFLKLINEWNKDKKEHIVMFCDENMRWFIDFISDEDIAVRCETERKIPPQFITKQEENIYGKPINTRKVKR